MMDAPITEADIQAHVDGRLPPDRRAAVEAWLLSHPEEARRVASYRGQTDMLRAALGGIAEEPLPPELDLRLRAKSARRWNGHGRSALVASAAGLLLMGGAAGWTVRGWDAPTTVGTGALAREATASYQVYASDASRPVEMAAVQQVALDSWFSRRLGRPIAAPDLRGAGLSLIGGRLVATEHGPAGLYLYRNGRGDRIALYIRPMEVEGTDRMTARRTGDVAGWTWADDGLGFGVFGSGQAEFLHTTADMVRGQFRRT